VIPTPTRPALDNQGCARRLTGSDVITVFGDLASSSTTGDDESKLIQVPFPISLWGRTSDHISVSTNGVFSVGPSSSMARYDKEDLPTVKYPTYSAMVFWEDLKYHAGTPQGIFYTVRTEGSRRRLMMEYCLGKYNDPSQYYHFEWSYYEDYPNLLDVRYFQLSDLSQGPVIGVQGDIGKAIQYHGNRWNGLQIYFNTTLYDEPNIITFDNPYYT
jgi:hypothetical protein